MKNRYVFPIFNNKNELIGFSGRTLVTGYNIPKWKHIGTKSNWCYPLKWNINLLKSSKEVILIESIGDMLSLWDKGIKNTIVTFGISISRSIIEFLLRIDAQKIIIAFNNDEDNNLVGNEAADKEKFHLSKYFDPHQIILAIPDYKDFGEMDEIQINLWKKKFQIQN
jgi:DNA primase